MEKRTQYRIKRERRLRKRGTQFPVVVVTKIRIKEHRSPKLSIEIRHFLLGSLPEN